MLSAKDKDWIVYFDKNFWSRKGEECAEKEIHLKKWILWEGLVLHIPSLYVSKSGVIVDICVETEPECVKQFIEKWNLYQEASVNYSEEEMERLQEENPLNWNTNIKLSINGQRMRNKSSCGVSWIPRLENDWENDDVAERILEHYQLKKEKAWGIRRFSFGWEEESISHIEKIEITFSQQPVSVPSMRFTTQNGGEKIDFVHPVTGQKHCLTIEKCEQESMEQKHFEKFGKGDMEYPTKYQVMTYTLEPELERSEFYIRDCSNGDAPRNKTSLGKNGKGAAAVGIIGHADGPVSVFVGAANKKKNVHTICSALHFEPVQKVEWRIGFYKKTREDLVVELSVN